MVSWIPCSRAIRRTCSGVYRALTPTWESFSPRPTASATATANSSRRRSRVFCARSSAALACDTGSVTSQVSQMTVSRSAPLTLMESPGRDRHIGTFMCHTLPDASFDWTPRDLLVRDRQSEIKGRPTLLRWVPRVPRLGRRSRAIRHDDGGRGSRRLLPASPLRASVVLPMAGSVGRELGGLVAARPRRHQRDPHHRRSVPDDRERSPVCGRPDALLRVLRCGERPGRQPAHELPDPVRRPRSGSGLEWTRLRLPDQRLRTKRLGATAGSGRDVHGPV